jgi:hypothetical protein
VAVRTEHGTVNGLPIEFLDDVKQKDTPERSYLEGATPAEAQETGEGRAVKGAGLGVDAESGPGKCSILTAKRVNHAERLGACGTCKCD